MNTWGEAMLDIKNEDKTLIISHILYSGEQQIVKQSVLESAWAFVMFDEHTEAGDIIKYLNNANVTDDNYHDHEVSRTALKRIRRVGFENVKLTIDPHYE